MVHIKDTKNEKILHQKTLNKAVFIKFISKKGGMKNLI